MLQKTYVMSDIHGEYDKFLKMLALIDFSDKDSLIILGDVVDRGSHPIEIIEYIMAHENIELIMGNHEDMFIEYLQTINKLNKNISREVWMRNGGHPTIEGFEKRDRDKQVDIQEFIQCCPLYKVIDNFILVHSGLIMPMEEEKFTLKEILEMQDKVDFLWSRGTFFPHKGITDYQIIFGHTRTFNLRGGSRYDIGADLIWHDPIYKDKIGIDCGAVSGLKLGCLRLNDMKEFYV